MEHIHYKTRNLNVNFFRCMETTMLIIWVLYHAYTMDVLILYHVASNREDSMSWIINFLNEKETPISPNFAFMKESPSNEVITETINVK